MHGALVDTPPPDLFRRLAAQTATGTLTLSGGDGEASVLFVHGTIAAAHSPTTTGTSRVLRLGERLVHAGRLEADDLDRALADQAAAAAPVALGHLLVERQLVDADVVRVLLQEQALDALGVILTWTSGQYHFEVDPAPAARVTVSLPVDRAVVEVRRRARERRRVRELVPGPGAVPHPTGAPSPEVRLSPDAVSVLTAVDGRVSVGAIASTLGYGYDEASRIVYRLALQRLVECRDGEDTGPVATAAAAAATSAAAATPASSDPAAPSTPEPDRSAAAMPETTTWQAPDREADPDDEPRPWVGWAHGGTEPADDDTGAPAPASPAVDTGQPPGHDGPADASAPVGEAPPPAPVDEDTRRALFSELHAVSRAEPADAPAARPSAPSPEDTAEPPAEESRPEAPTPDDPDVPTDGPPMPDLSQDEVSSLLRELHDLTRDD